MWNIPLSALPCICIYVNYVMYILHSHPGGLNWRKKMIRMDLPFNAQKAECLYHKKRRYCRKTCLELSPPSGQTMKPISNGRHLFITVILDTYGCVINIWLWRFNNKNCMHKLAFVAMLSGHFRSNGTSYQNGTYHITYYIYIVWHSHTIRKH
jgi:hypothetical protein